MTEKQQSITIAARRVPKARPKPIKFTIKLDPEQAALLRVLATEWGMSQSQAVGTSLKFFFATGAGDAGSVSMNDQGRARIAAAVERAPLLAECATRDPRIHGRGDGGGGGGEDG